MWRTDPHFGADFANRGTVTLSLDCRTDEIKNPSLFGSELILEHANSVSVAIVSLNRNIVALTYYTNVQALGRWTLNCLLRCSEYVDCLGRFEKSVCF